jgi:adenine-specific DNA-methyltransferase
MISRGSSRGIDKDWRCHIQTRRGPKSFRRHAYFLGASAPYKLLKTTLKAEIDKDAWEKLYSDVFRPFDKPKSELIAVNVINHLGDEVMKGFGVN